MRKPLTSAEIRSLPLDEQIQLFGANARARGEPLASNPYWKRDEALTAEEWSRRLELWEAGWRIEDLMR